MGFAAGNLLLARVLPKDDYGRISLFLALVQLGMVLGPLGVETVINRHHLSASPRLLGRVGASGALAGAAFASVAWLFYGFDAALALVLGVTAAGAAINRVAGAFFQSRGKLGFSLFLILIHNWIVLAAVPIVLLFREPQALAAAMTVLIGYLIMATVGWRKGFLIARSAAPAPIDRRTLLQEGLAAVGLQIAVGALFQLDRLVIPHALSIGDLALYSVVSSIAASPFRMLQTGLGFALLPRLRACQTRAAIHRVLRHEMLVAALVAIAAAAGVLLLTRWLLGALLGDRYKFDTGLLYALVVVGLVRVWSGFSGATVSALGSTRQLATLNGWGWLALACAAAGAFILRGYGLTGVVYGMGAGWLTLAVAGTLIGSRAIVMRGVSSTAPR